MVNIFIANLDWSITSEDLKTTFSSFGEVNLAHVVFDAKTKRSKGFGYVEMPDSDAAIAAIEALNGMEINGRPIDVKIASPKNHRPKPTEKPENDFKKPFKKPFNKSGGNYRGGGSGYRSQDSSGYKPREHQGGSRFDSKESSSDEPKRVLRPRRKREE